MDLFGIGSKIFDFGCKVADAISSVSTSGNSVAVQNHNNQPSCNNSYSDQSVAQMQELAMRSMAAQHNCMQAMLSVMQNQKPSVQNNIHVENHYNINNIGSATFSSTDLSEIDATKDFLKELFVGIRKEYDHAI